jgi:hypothetical protein
MWAQIVTIVSCGMSLLLVLRVNLLIGVSDLTLVFLTSPVLSVFIMAFTHLPNLVLFAKLIPLHIEATMFSSITSILNLAPNQGGRGLGIVINSFVGVSLDNMDRYYILCVIQGCMSFIPFCFLWLIPSKHEVTQVQM